MVGQEAGTHNGQVPCYGLEWQKAGVRAVEAGVDYSWW